MTFSPYKEVPHHELRNIRIVINPTKEADTLVKLYMVNSLGQ